MLLNRRPRTRRNNNGMYGKKENGESPAGNVKEAKKTKRRALPLTQLRRRGAVWLGRERRWKLLLLIVLLSVIAIKWIARPLEVKYFGNHDMEGGELGAKMDRRNRRFHRRWIEKRRRERLQELGIVLPPLDESRNEKYLTITSDILARRAERKRKLNYAKHFVEKRQDYCQSSSASPHDNNITSIPRHILQMNDGPWFRPRNDNRMTIIPFDEHVPSLFRLYERSSGEGRMLLWSIYALYEYGGYIFGRSVAQVTELIDEVDDEFRNTCDDFAAFKFIRQSPSDNQLEFLMLAASPRHPLLKCSLHRLETFSGTLDDESILASLYSPQSWNSSETRRAVHGDSQLRVFPDSWEVIRANCPNHEASFCCEDVNLSTSDNVESRHKNAGQGEAKIFVKLATPAASSRNGESQQRNTSSHTLVYINERPNTLPATKHVKVSVRDVMRKSRCDAGWRCHRCLHNPVYGTYESCESVCDKCFIDLICNQSSTPTKKTVTFDVVVRQNKCLLSGENRIPRVVHQTWFEDLNTDRYPQLVRVQSSWKNSGYEYRFYTDSDAREYIATNFPSRFLEAYDSLVPGAFKADLFRSLVLLKDGGIYADADVLLGANLDAFITPQISFFVPLDLVGADYDEEFCLWNGLIGAAPGHPILVEAVEWLVNMILNRADAYDFERELCRGSGKSLQVWKVRQGRLLLLSGPCALGVAANRARGNSDPVARIESGWLPSEQNATNIGDSLVLKGDKFDMNAFRFTDMDRNLIVASTDMIDLTTTPLETKKNNNLRRSVHYSETEALDDVFGTKGVYKDNMVTNEEIRLKVTREYLD